MARKSGSHSVHRKTGDESNGVYNSCGTWLWSRTSWITHAASWSSSIFPGSQRGFASKGYSSYNRAQRGNGVHFAVSFVEVYHRRCKLICGEWSETAAMIDATKIDYILASDTIYTPATIRSFVSVVNQLADHNTVCWIASQKYYFGLGGGTQALIDIIKEMKLPLTIKILETLGEDTVKRDIICIQKKYLHC